MNGALKWIMAVVILIAATVATGGLDLPALLLAGGVFVYFQKATK